jgi:hypothetical protein
MRTHKRPASLGEHEKTLRPSAINLGRYRFLKVVEECEPSFRSELLEGEPGKLFKKLPADIGLGLTRSSLGQDRRTADFARALQSWAKRWHLEEDWIKDQALHLLQLSFWPQSPDEEMDEADFEEIEVDWARPVSLWIRTDEFTFKHPGVDLAIQTIQEIADEIRDSFEKELNSYLKQLKALAKERGGVPTVTTKKREHFEILARYQMQRRTHEQLAAEYDFKDISSVAHIIKQVKDLIGIEPSPKRGRPRLDAKSRSKQSRVRSR